MPKDASLEQIHPHDTKAEAFRQRRFVRFNLIIVGQTSGGMGASATAYKSQPRRKWSN
jgi:hypothetical protein